MAPRHTTVLLLLSTAISAAGCIHHYHFEPTTRQAEYFDPSTWFLDGVSADEIANRLRSSSDPTDIAIGLVKIADILVGKNGSLERIFGNGVPTNRAAIFEARAGRISPRSSWAGGISAPYLKHDSAEVRTSALDVLAMLGPHALPWISEIRTAASADPSTKVRLRAILALMRTGVDYDFANAAIRPHLDSPDPLIALDALRVFSYTQPTQESIQVAQSMIESRASSLSVAQQAATVVTHLKWKREWMYSDPVPDYSW